MARPKPLLPLLAAALLLVAVLLHQPVHVDAQKVITNLGTKLKQFADPSATGSRKKKKYVTVKDDIVTDQEQRAEEIFDQVDLGFEDVKMVLRAKKGKEDRIILDGSIRGRAEPGRMLAIMGPSGSGKSTLVHALAGKLKSNSKLSLYGRRYLNGEELSSDSSVPAAFIQQEVNFFPHMTVQETLDFRVELKLAKKLGKSARDEVVQDLIHTFGLTKSANTIVGNSKVRGLSGGERKRLSIACEMISSPSVIFLDEPTSGLDSYQAAQVVETLRTLADQGKTIISVIHQPSQGVFNMFDDLLLLSEGKQMYWGPRKDARSYMENLGYKADSDVGTAEHVLECVSVVNGGDEVHSESIDRINSLAQQCISSNKDKVIVPSTTNADRKSATKRRLVDKSSSPKASVLLQFKLLLKRAVQETLRAKGTIIIKTVQQVTLGLIYGGIYTLGNNQASIQDRFGLLFLIVTGATNMAMAGTIRAFPKEKAIVSGELSFGLYRTLPYFLAKAISEIPLIGFFQSAFGVIVYKMCGLQEKKLKSFLGLVTMHSIASEGVGLMISSVAPSSSAALALFPPIIILNLIFDGKNISLENTPRALRWIHKVGLIRWGLQALAVNEFKGLEFDTKGPRRGPVCKTGEEALSMFGMDGGNVNDSIKAMGSIIGTCWVMSYLGLTLTRQKFMAMLPPEEEKQKK